MAVVLFPRARAGMGNRLGLLPAIIAVPVTGIRRKRRVTTRP
ncbi:hypothetical protein [Actinoplanes awajinensis]|nr:hypothetical protein [Actinoplanes awajinensis]